MRLPVAYREFKPDDLNFILNSWLISYRNSDEFKRVDNKNYYAEQTKVLFGIIQNPETKITIAVNKEDSEQIFSYLVYNPNEKLIHYAYTKYPFRRYGLIKEQAKRAEIDNETWEATFYKNFSPFKYVPLKRR